MPSGLGLAWPSLEAMLGRSLCLQVWNGWVGVGQWWFVLWGWWVVVGRPAWRLGWVGVCACRYGMAGLGSVSGGLCFGVGGL